MEREKILLKPWAALFFTDCVDLKQKGEHNLNKIPNKGF